MKSFSSPLGTRSTSLGFRSLAALLNLAPKAPKSSTATSPTIESILSSSAHSYSPSRVHASTLPPPYREAAGVDYSDAVPKEGKLSMEVVERRMQAWDFESERRRDQLLRVDRRIGAALASVAL